MSGFVTKFERRLNDGEELGIVYELLFLPLILVLLVWSFVRRDGGLQ